MIEPAESIRGMVAGQMGRMRNGHLWPDAAEACVCIRESARYLRAAHGVLTRGRFDVQEPLDEFAALEAAVATVREHFKEIDARRGQ